MADDLINLQAHLAGTLYSNLMRIGIRFKVSDVRRLNRAMNKVRTRATFWVENEMQRLCASDLADNIYSAITRGKYYYKPYTMRYARWKETYFGGRPFWALKYDLANNIRAFVVSTAGAKKVWAAGVPEGVMDTGGKSWFGRGNVGTPKEIAMYGSVNERLRPLWRPETIEYAGWPWRSRGRLALSQIRGGWR